MIEARGFRRDGFALFGLEGTLPFIDSALVGSLIQEALNEKHSIRFCLHDSPENALHNMIICDLKGTALGPHRHMDKAETIHCMRGRVNVRCYSDAGEEKSNILLEIGSIFRIPPKVFHTVTCVSQFAVYHESKPGPFLGAADREMAPWEVEL